MACGRLVEREIRLCRDQTTRSKHGLERWVGYGVASHLRVRDVTKAVGIVTSHRQRKPPDA
jgi:hypothetical protein